MNRRLSKKTAAGKKNMHFSICAWTRFSDKILTTLVFRRKELHIAFRKIYKQFIKVCPELV